MEFKHFTIDGSSFCEVTHEGQVFRLSVDTRGKHNGKWFLGHPGKRVQVPTKVAKGPHDQLELYLSKLILGGEMAPDKPESASKRLNIYRGAGLDAYLGARPGNVSGTLSAACERLGYLLDRARESLPFSEGEWAVIQEGLAKVLVSPAQILVPSIPDAVERSVTAKGVAKLQGVDFATLVEKLRGLDDLRRVCVIDTLERRNFS